MLNLCKEKFKDTKLFKENKLSFLQADADSLELHDNYSLIISNACFQWLKKLEGDLLNYVEHLQKEGILAFTIFSKDNFYELRECSGVSLEYIDKSTLKKILKRLTVLLTSRKLSLKVTLMT